MTFEIAEGWEIVALAMFIGVCAPTAVHVWRQYRAIQRAKKIVVRPYTGDWPDDVDMNRGST